MHIVLTDKVVLFENNTADSCSFMKVADDTVTSEKNFQQLKIDRNWVQMEKILLG